MSVASRVKALERAAGVTDSSRCGCQPLTIYLLGGPVPIPPDGPCPTCGRLREAVVITGADGGPMPGLHRLPSRAVRPDVRGV